jgi:hypothetical protein
MTPFFLRPKEKGTEDGALISDRRLATRVMAGAAMFIAILLVSIVSTASAADAFPFGFRGPSVRTETA